MLTTENLAARRSIFVAVAAAVIAMVSGCSPSGPEALRAGKDLLERNRPLDAVRHLQAATELMRSNATAWNYLGLAHHYAGDFTNALLAYHRALDFNPALAEARFNLGCLYLDNRQPEFATNEFTAFSVRRPRDLEGWLKLGTAQLRARNPAGAERSFTRALQLTSNHIEALNGLGLASAQRNRAREAAALFQRALKVQTDYAPALLNLAVVEQVSLNDPTSALAHYRAYLAVQPRPPAYMQAGAAAAALAAQLAPRPIATNVTVPTTLASNATPRLATNLETPPPRSPAPRTNATATRTLSPTPMETVRVPAPVQVSDPKGGQKAADESKPASALSATEATGVETAQQTQPETTAPVPRSTTTPAALKFKRYSYGVTPPSRGDRDAALPKFGEGLSSQRAGDLNNALTAYREAIQKDPAFFEAYFNLGVAAYDTGQLSASLAAYETALTLRPDSRDARYNFALALRAADYPLDAMEELQKLASSDSGEVRIQLSLGNLYAQQLGQPTLARQHYERVLALEPGHPQAVRLRAWLAANPE